MTSEFQPGIMYYPEALGHEVESQSAEILGARKGIACFFNEETLLECALEGPILGLRNAALGWFDRRKSTRIDVVEITSNHRSPFPPSKNTDIEPDFPGLIRCRLLVVPKGQRIYYSEIHNLFLEAGLIQ